MDYDLLQNLQKNKNGSRIDTHISAVGFRQTQFRQKGHISSEQHLKTHRLICKKKKVERMRILAIAYNITYLLYNVK